MHDARPVGRRYGASLLAAALLLGTTAALAAPAMADQVSADRSAQAQAMLDRVLGPGNSVVEIAATVRAGSGSSTTVAWGAAVPAQVAAVRARSGSSTAGAFTSTNAVDSTTTTLATPAGALIRQTVSVAVDRTALETISIARLRHLVAAAVGLTPSRGDRLVLVATPFARRTTPAAARPSWTDGLAGAAIPLMWAGGALVALLVLVLALGGRPSSDVGHLRRS